MKIRIEFNADQLRELVATEACAKLNVRATRWEVKFKVRPIHWRRKHPRACPIEMAVIETAK